MSILVTIITDASVNSQTGAAGWAGQVILGGQRFVFSRHFKSLMTSSHDAEICAVVNTIHCGYSHIIPLNARLLVQLDNTRTVQVLRRTVTKNGLDLTSCEKEAIAHLERLMLANATESLTIRHVKAHVPATKREARHHVHEKLDRLAKKARLEEATAAGHLSQSLDKKPPPT